MATSGRDGWNTLPYLTDTMQPPSVFVGHSVGGATVLMTAALLFLHASWAGRSLPSDRTLSGQIEVHTAAASDV